MSYHCKNCGSVDRINHKDKCVDCGSLYKDNKINGLKVDSIEFDEFQDSYALIYVTKDEEGKPFKYYQENLTKEECEIIYGNISDIIVVWNMILREKENEQ